MITIIKTIIIMMMIIPTIEMINSVHSFVFSCICEFVCVCVCVFCSSFFVFGFTNEHWHKHDMLCHSVSRGYFLVVVVLWKQQPTKKKQQQKPTTSTSTDCECCVCKGIFHICRCVCVLWTANVYNLICISLCWYIMHSG